MLHIIGSMRKSSSLTLFFRYFLTISIGALYILDYVLDKIGIVELIFLVIISLPIYLLILGRLRSVTATKNGIITETLRYEEAIKYEEINYITQFAFFKPVLIIISYDDTENGKTRKSLTMGSLSEKMFSFDYFNLAELEQTKFIRKKVLASQPDYDEEKEPSRWALALITFGVVVLMFIVGITFESIDNM